jgi:hypothetical protein
MDPNLIKLQNSRDIIKKLLEYPGRGKNEFPKLSNYMMSHSDFIKVMLKLNLFTDNYKLTGKNSTSNENETLDEKKMTDELKETNPDIFNCSKSHPCIKYPNTGQFGEWRKAKNLQTEFNKITSEMCISKKDEFTGDVIETVKYVRKLKDAPEYRDIIKEIKACSIPYIIYSNSQKNNCKPGILGPSHILNPFLDIVPDIDTTDEIKYMYMIFLAAKNWMKIVNEQYIMCLLNMFLGNMCEIIMYMFYPKDKE